jgi:hypothetical protein
LIRVRSKAEVKRSNIFFNFNRPDARMTTREYSRGDRKKKAAQKHAALDALTTIFSSLKDQYHLGQNASRLEVMHMLLQEAGFEESEDGAVGKQRREQLEETPTGFQQFWATPSRKRKMLAS